MGRRLRVGLSALAVVLLVACATELEDFEVAPGAATGSGASSSGSPTGGGLDSTSASMGTSSGSTGKGGGSGCGADLMTDVANCGACGHVCGGPNTLGPPACIGGLCQTPCSTGFADCSHPQGTEPDDGCETPANTPQHCGSCGNVCAQGFSCHGDSKIECVCGSGTCGVDGTCKRDKCECGSSSPDQCEEGEICMGDTCTCNGGPACSSKTCCVTGCADLDQDPLNCGGCGHACPQNWNCCEAVCKRDGCG